jgi:hypothetical protein
MSTQKKAGLAVFSLVLLALLAVGGYEYKQSRIPQACGFCQRPLREKLWVIAEVDGDRRHVCCPQCAVTEGRQEHKPVRLIMVHDYASGRELDPKQAWYVNESRAIACSHDGMRMDEMKHTETVTFDRCSPGAFAFAKKEDAETFISQNGGQLLSLEQLLGEVKQ